jgi:hypothetical protein
MLVCFRESVAPLATHGDGNTLHRNLQRARRSGLAPAPARHSPAKAFASMASGTTEQDQMTHAPRRKHATSKLSGLVLAAALAGVSAGCAQRSGAEITSLPADLSCADDSARCIAARARGLRALRSDTSRAWLATPPTAPQYAAGVRLFAMRKDRASFSCTQLKLSAAEAARSPSVLRSPEARARLTPAQISRGVLLAEDVGRDLQRELRKKRCKT